MIVVALAATIGHGYQKRAIKRSAKPAVWASLLTAMLGLVLLKPSDDIGRVFIWRKNRIENFANYAIFNN